MVPVGPDWIHEIKYDGYRLRVERQGKTVRLFTHNGHDWTKRYPWIVEAALKNREQQFVIDGEAVVLGVDGASDFNALHSRRHDDEVQLSFGLQYCPPKPGDRRPKLTPYRLVCCAACFGMKQVVEDADRGDDCADSARALHQGQDDQGDCP
ncbi:ATP-dependent DNA ligase [Bradyrhizobium japonicum]|uniref:ATP-dependent DNA ligase n=1 Tax=Bradyrhizobium japonicum TaxID=375 RepID=UPI00209E6296|nr:hypothetical protein [Bradyrhizobium japonicum]MCP1766038.1 hypothetical protein [Bradyrhizobium japonicum]MCP1788175.1 hypothetical protein [Bradyrhizobium japonicum]MCP1810051.1 hypothetical protein [Bradyrhizobium japonicum]MCP1818985.1 hypothetical protein [Bradyrhizobium japonicum]MCP1869505.1 hypothetical protein [Bradyrhizobium japonicum]